MVFTQQARFMCQRQVDKALVIRVFAAQRGARGYFYLVAMRVEVAQQVLCAALVKVHAFGDMRVAQHAGQFLAHGRSADPADARLHQGLAQRLGGGVGKEKYIEHLLTSLTTRLDGLKIVVDCANGAASFVAAYKTRAYSSVGGEKPS